MGIGGISIWQLLIVLAIIFLLFGTKRLRNLGSDLGSAIKGFRKTMKDEGENKDNAEEDDDPRVIEGKAESVDQQQKASSDKTESR